MSLINEALKKAQRSRTAGANSSLPPMPGGGHIAKRGQVPSANTMVLIASSAVVLVVLSVVATIYLVNRPSPKPLPPTIATKPAVVAPAEAATPAIVRPLLPAKPVAATTTPPPEVPATDAPGAATTTPGGPPASPEANPPLSTATVATPASSTPLPPTATQAPAPAPGIPPPLPSAPATPPRPDERISAYIEALRIAGVRAQGDDSRVLINERVYRVNDIIERTLGIRLIKVESGSLIFGDANGATYLKYL